MVPITNLWFKQFSRFLCCFYKEWFRLCHSKICKKTKMQHSKAWKIRVKGGFIPKAFPKILSGTNFWLKHLSRPFFTFLEDGFNFVTQKLYSPQGSFKPKFKNSLYGRVLIQTAFKILACFLREKLHFSYWKTYKKAKTAIFKYLEHSLFTSRKLQNNFLLCSQRQSFGWNSFESLTLLLKKSRRERGKKEKWQRKKNFIFKTHNIRFRHKSSLKTILKFSPRTTLDLHYF